MKIVDVIIISLVIALSIIGIHQSVILGFGSSYWIFMLTLALLLWYKIRNSRQEVPPTQEENKKRSKRKVKMK